MRRSDRLDEKQDASLENESQIEPKTNEDQSENRISKVAALDNGTMIEVFKFFNYCQQAKSSCVSKRFWNLIRNNRHRLALLLVDRITMQRDHGSDTASIKMFGEDISPEAYDEWVTRNQYSKESPLKGQDVATEIAQDDDDGYRLDVQAYYSEYRGYYDKTSIFNARVKLNHENWPLFQHFVRLLTDPFICICNVELTNQNDVFNLFAGVINQNRNHLKCKQLTFYFKGDAQKFIGWIKDHVCCDKFEIKDYSDSNLDEELLDLFLTGANCAFHIRVNYYDPSRIIVGFVQNFMDLKECDEYQIVESIKCDIGKSVEVLKGKYAEFIVKEEEYHQSFEFVNNNIGKKLKITAKYFFSDCVGFSDALSCESISLET